MLVESQTAREQVANTLDGAALRRVLGEIAQALQGLKYGDVTVLIRDGGVIRVERTEKTRLFRGKH